MTRLRLYVALLVIALTPLVGCQVNPATGERQLILVSSEQVNALGAQAQPELVQEYGGEIDVPQLRQYVSEVGQSLAAQVEGEYTDLPWQFIVLDSDVINAFALPGGRVFISRGLMERFENEAQLAGVLGHEIGHVTGRHINERISQGMVVQGLGSVADAAAGSSEWSQVVGLVVGVGGQGYLLKFGRDQESQADVLGVRYMVEAGYDPMGMIGVLEVLDEASAGGATPEFLSTHPHPQTRLTTVTNLLRGRYAYTQNNPDFTLKRDRWQSRAAPYLNAPAQVGMVSPGAFSGAFLDESSHIWCNSCGSGEN